MDAKEWMALKALRLQDWQPLYAEMLQEQDKMLTQMAPSGRYDFLVSYLNLLRSAKRSCIMVSVGDVCFVDYGPAYRLEIGQFHFGLVIAIFHGKIAVVPISGNQEAYEKTKLRSHTLRLEELGGLNKPSFLYLNDLKWISPRRILDIKGHVSLHQVDVVKKAALAIFEVQS